MKTKKVKTVVLGGGGNKGASGVGKLTKLNLDFDRVIGCSTGALQCIHVALRMYKDLKRIYLNPSQGTVFKKHPIFGFPFTNKGKLRIFPFLLWRLIAGKPTIAESEPLLAAINENVTEEMWKKLKDLGKEVIVCVYNYTELKVEFKSSNDIDDRQEFIEWMYASACQPPFMSIYKKDGYEYVDGGISTIIPMVEALIRGCSSLDVIALRPEVLPVSDKSPIKNIVHNVWRAQNSQRHALAFKNLREGIHRANDEKIPYRIHYLPYGYGENDLDFSNSEKLKQWYMNAYHEKIIDYTT